MNATRISRIICIAISFAWFWFALSGLFLSNSSFSLICLQNCFWCWKFDSKFSSSFLDCNFTRSDSLNEFFTHFLRNNWIFLLLRAKIFLRLIHISISSITSLFSITWYATRVKISILIYLRLIGHSSIDNNWSKIRST